MIAKCRPPVRRPTSLRLAAAAVDEELSEVARGVHGLGGLLEACLQLQALSRVLGAAYRHVYVCTLCVYIYIYTDIHAYTYKVIYTDMELQQ